MTERDTRQRIDPHIQEVRKEVVETGAISLTNLKPGDFLTTNIFKPIDTIIMSHKDGSLEAPTIIAIRCQRTFQIDVSDRTRLQYLGMNTLVIPPENPADLSDEVGVAETVEIQEPLLLRIHEDEEIYLSPIRDTRRKPGYEYTYTLPISGQWSMRVERYKKGELEAGIPPVGEASLEALGPFDIVMLNGREIYKRSFTSPSL